MLLQIAEGSPQAVAAQDQAAWLALFSDDAEVHDPVGARPHPTPGLGAFWNTFIAGNGIRFLVDRDLVCGEMVVRDLTIETTFPGGVQLMVPAHLRYQVVNGRLRRLYAHWELLAMVGLVIKKGPGAWWAMTGVSLAMIRYLGIGGLLAYLGGLRGVGRGGKAKAMALCGQLASEPGRIPVQLSPRDRRWVPSDGPLALKLSKLLAAGQHVTATAEISLAGEQKPGVAHFRFERGEIAEVVLYY